MRPLIIAAGILIVNVVPACAQSPVSVARIATVAGRSMRFAAAGLDARKPGQPIVVLEAGAGATLQMWTPVFQQIAAIAPVMAYDRRGLGQSDSDNEPQSLTRVIGSLHDLLGEIKAPPPYVLVGASYGGVIIRAFAQAFPTEVAGLVYLDVPDIDATYAEADAIGARHVLFNVPEIPADMPSGMRAEMENIARNIRTEFAEMREARPPSTIPAAVVIGAGKSWPGASPEMGESLLRLQMKHQQEWALSTPQGLFLASRHLRHFVHQNDPALTVRTVQYILGVTGK